jgi:4-hydroxy-tetrahydrodipicolinate synthase
MPKKIGYEIVLPAPPFYTRPTQQELIKHYETVL